MSQLQPVPAPDANEQLAWDIAVRLLTPAEICQKHGVTGQQVQKLLQNRSFQQMVVEYRKDWESPQSGDERVSAKATMALESGLAHMHAIVADPMAANTDRTNAFKAIHQASSVSRAQKSQIAKGGGPQGVQVNINLNGHTTSLDFDPAEIIDVEPDNDED